MADRFRDFDWASTPLGPVDRWPESWRNAVNIILDSSFPTALALGSELIYFYNDAFIPLAGPSRQPHGLGTPVPFAWKEIWEQILAHRFDYTLRTGMATGEADLLMPLERSGYLEACGFRGAASISIPTGSLPHITQHPPAAACMRLSKRHWDGYQMQSRTMLRGPNEPSWMKNRLSNEPPAS
jgi:hypothetical protein